MNKKFCLKFGFPEDNFLLSNLKQENQDLYLHNKSIIPFKMSQPEHIIEDSMITLLFIVEYLFMKVTH